MKRYEQRWPAWNWAWANSQATGYGLFLAVVMGSVGCQSGGAGNPFQSAPTRIPAPPTRSLQSNGNYYNGGAGTNGVPSGAIGTGIPSGASVPSGASGANWSSTPNAVNAANSAGVYTSSLERTGSGYIIRTVPSGGSSPTLESSTIPNGNTRSSAPVDPRFPTTTFANSGYAVQPAEYQQSSVMPPPSNQPYSNPRYADSAPYVPPTDAALTPSPASGNALNWRSPRP